MDSGIQTGDLPGSHCSESLWVAAPCLSSLAARQLNTMKRLALRRLAMTCGVCTSQIFSLYCLTKCTYCMSSCSLKRTYTYTHTQWDISSTSFLWSAHSDGSALVLVVLSGPYTQGKKGFKASFFFNPTSNRFLLEMLYQIQAENRPLKSFLNVKIWFKKNIVVSNSSYSAQFHTFRLCCVCAENVLCVARKQLSMHPAGFTVFAGPPCAWLRRKTLRRKCFPQLLGGSFSTLRPTKRQIAAKSRDSSCCWDAIRSYSGPLKTFESHSSPSVSRGPFSPRFRLTDS